MRHFLQSPAWGRFQRARGNEVFEASGSGWEYLAILERKRLGTRLYVPYGPSISQPGAFALAAEALEALAHDQGAAFIRMEPLGEVTEEELGASGAQRVDHIQPESTQRIDVSVPFADVMKGFSSSRRNLHRNYAKKGLSIRRSSDPKDIEHLLTLLHGVAERASMNPQSDDYLRSQAEIFLPTGDGWIYLVEHEGNVVAASLIFDDGKVRYYAHAAADDAVRKLSPGSVLLSQMIEDAQADGRAEVDLMGVVSPDAPKDHPWAGFSNFKRSFGGYQKDYLGTWELPIKSLTYKLYRAARAMVTRVRG